MILHSLTLSGGMKRGMKGHFPPVGNSVPNFPPVRRKIGKNQHFRHFFFFFFFLIYAPSETRFPPQCPHKKKKKKKKKKILVPPLLALCQIPDLKGQYNYFKAFQKLIRSYNMFTTDLTDV